MSVGRSLRLTALVLGIGAAVGSAHAAVFSATPGRALTTVPFTVLLGANKAGFAFTAASTDYGPGVAVQTIGTNQVTTFFGGITDFGSGASIDQTDEVYGFSTVPMAGAIPYSVADDFIGLAFNLADGVHYGYAEVAGPTLVSYGYESSPGTTILTGAAGAAIPSPVPEPASAALLLVGAAGLVAARRSARS